MLYIIFWWDQCMHSVRSWIFATPYVEKREICFDFSEFSLLPFSANIVFNKMPHLVDENAIQQKNIQKFESNSIEKKPLKIMNKCLPVVSAPVTFYSLHHLRKC